MALVPEQNSISCLPTVPLGAISFAILSLPLAKFAGEEVALEKYNPSSCSHTVSNACRETPKVSPCTSHIRSSHTWLLQRTSVSGLGWAGAEVSRQNSWCIAEGLCWRRGLEQMEGGERGLGIMQKWKCELPV